MFLVLPLVVFTSGAVVMILELVASRIIAPYLGTSVVVWTSLIGVILAALSVGNWLGGKLADRYPSLRTLALALLTASILIGLNGHFQTILAYLSTYWNLQAATLTGVFLLFGPATVALGTIAPLCIKLSLQNLEKSGSTVGQLYALSNAGSIVGTFMGGFILISLIGSTRILTLLALTLLSLALFLLVASRFRPSPRELALFALSGLMLIPSNNAIVLAHGSRVLADVDTQYARTWVVDFPMGEVTARTINNSVLGNQSGMLVEHPDEPLFAYIRAFDIFEAFNPAASKALMFGGSGYTYPRHFLRGGETRKATVVEIDPGVTELARQFFHLKDDPRLTIVHEDGRMFLNRGSQDATEKFDIVVMDAFSSRNSIPFHLTTIEAVQKISERLSPEGIVLINVVSALEGFESQFLSAEYATYKKVFPYLRLFPVEDLPPSQYQNLILVASPKPLVAVNHSTVSDKLLEREWLKPLLALPVLTDDFAPVEKYTGTL